MAELPRVPVQSRASHQLQDSPCSWSVQLFLAISEEREVAQCSLPVLPAGEAMSATAHIIVCFMSQHCLQRELLPFPSALFLMETDSTSYVHSYSW